MRAVAIFCLIVLLGSLPDTGCAEEPPALAIGTLSAVLDRESASVGSTVALTLEYRLPRGASLSEPPSVKGLEGLTIVERKVSPGSIRFRLLVDRLETWRSGPIVLAYRGADGKPGTLETGPVSLTVLSNLGEDPSNAALRPIQGVLSTRSPLQQALPWVLGVVGILGAAGVAFLLLRRRRVPTVLATPVDPPHVRARRALEALEGQRLFEKGRVKPFYFGFSQILRQYLESLRGFPAAEYTTEEISRAIRHEPDRRLLVLLRTADLVKFADSVPSLGCKEDQMRDALAFIDETATGNEMQPAAGPEPGAGK